MPAGPVEAEGAAPVVTHQRDAVEAESVEPGVEIASVVGEAIADLGLARPPHSDQVRGQAAALTG